MSDKSGQTEENEAKSQSGWMTRLLEKAPQPVFVFYATAVAFCTYFCMYAFRKPFSAAKFDGEEFGWFSSDVTLKSAVVISQILGYALSKYIGLKVCSEITPSKRAWMMVGLILFAETSLLFYGFVPGEWKVIPIFFNGLPLGMVWGVVVWFLEGRRTSEILMAGLSCSFIMSSGIVKDFGIKLMNGTIASQWESIPIIGSVIGGQIGEVSESWMPFIVGLHFLPLFFLSVWMLSRIPKPNQKDVEERAERTQMNGSRRWDFIKQFAFGLSMLCIVYLLITVFRDFRDNFMVDILEDLGVEDNEDNDSFISTSETIVAFIVMGVMAGLNILRNNRRGLIAAFIVMGVGCFMLAFSSFAISEKSITPFSYMVATGLGSYLIYVPFNSMLFDRIIAVTKFSGTAVFAIYVADSIGYSGVVVLLFIKDRIFSEISHFQFFNSITLHISYISLIFLVASLFYFLNKKPAK